MAATPAPTRDQFVKEIAMSNRKVAIKARAYRIMFAVASIAAIVEVLGAGRRF
jgi:hypothetical protein